jgi:Zn-finger nucleic acid-binding protein
MRHQSKYGTTIDVCREHGVWLDAKELDRMVASVRRRAAFRTQLAARRAYREGVVSGQRLGLLSLLFG